MKTLLLLVTLTGSILIGISTTAATLQSDIPESSIAVGYCKGTADALLSYYPNTTCDSVSYAIKLPVNMLQKGGTQIYAFRIAIPDTCIRKGKLFITQKLENTVPLYTQEFDQLTLSNWNLIQLDQPFTWSEDIKNLFIGITVWSDIPSIGIEDGTYSNLSADYALLNKEWIHLSSMNYRNKITRLCIQAMMTGGNYSKESPQYDLAVENILSPLFSNLNEELTQTAIIRNTGVHTIKNFQLKCNIGEEEKVLNITDVAIPSGDAYLYTFRTKPTIEGKYSTCLEVTAVEGSATTDEVSENNLLKVNTEIYPKCFRRKVLLEQFTGQNCSYCPFGHLAVRETAIPYRHDLVWMAHYSYDWYFKGPLSLEINQTVADAFGVSGAPMAMIDRTSVTDNPNEVVFNPMAFIKPEFIQRRLDTPSFISISLKGTTFDVSSRILTVKVSGEVVKEYDNLKLNLFLTQDSLIAWQSGMGGFGSDEYCHNHVVRAVITDNTLGDDLCFKNGTFEKTYIYTVPDKVGNISIDLQKLKINAFIESYAPGIDFKNIEVHNAAVMPFTDIPNLPPDFIETGRTTNRVQCYALGHTVYFQGTYKHAEVYTQSGQLIHRIINETSFDLPEGFYFLRVTSIFDNPQIFKLLIQ